MAEFDFLATHAESLPTKPAVILGDTTLDFASLNRRANRAANVFKGLGCEAGDRVAIMSFNSIAGFEIGNGVRRSGTVVVPVNYRLRGPEIAYLLNDSGAKVVVAGPDHVDAVAAAQPLVTGDRRFIAIGDRIPDGWLSYRVLMDGAADTPPVDAVGDGLLASMIYTSGTTGNPK
ncbi:MAG TPA: AMP-binding protein, partial [Candidatus Acidoferrum sp.]|nr:AMP-binding protein [Candidatus Acidoferrum sp.]